MIELDFSNLESINKLEIDYEKGVLKINDIEIVDALEVRFPGPNGWERSQIFNFENFSPDADKTRTLRVCFEEEIRVITK